MPKQLLVLAGPDKGRGFSLDETYPLLLGRSRQTETRLTDQQVSRVHCEVASKGQNVVITDLDSAGGTYVNGQRISEVSLQPGDVIRIGQTEIRYQGEDISELKTLVPTDREVPASIPRPTPGKAPAVSKPPPAPGTSAAPLKRVPLKGGQLHELAGALLSHFEIGPVKAKARMGLVFQARDFKDDREVAFKVLYPEFSRSEGEMQRFIRAMRTMLPLRHPNLVALYGAGKTGPYCWISMEFVKGQSLTQVIERIGVAGMLDWRHALRIGVHMALALDFAHGNQIIHRNIRPSNILIASKNKVAKLGDLMLAKAIEGNLAQQITRPGEVLGDVRYMSPEQTTGDPNVDGRSDIYSLGATLYAVLTGQPPFDSPSMIETIGKIRSAEPARPKKFSMAIPDQMESVVLKMLAKRPEDRYPTAADLLTALERVAKFNGVKL